MFNNELDDELRARRLLEAATGHAVSFEDSQAFIDALRVGGSDESWFRSVELLTQRWGLNECEAGDLSATAQVLWGIFGLRGRALALHLEMRAEMLKLAGSSAQEMYDGFEKMGNELRDAGKETAS